MFSYIYVLPCWWAVAYCGARSEEGGGAGLVFGVGRFIDLVGLQRAVRPRRRNGIERQVDERAACVAKGPELRRGAELVEPALRRRLLHPFQKARDRDPVADMRGAGAAEFGIILDRLGQHRGEIGRASRRERACKYVSISVVAV